MAARKSSKNEGQAIEQLFERAMADPEAILPEGMAERVEAEITGAGNMAVSRRTALAYLERPFGETTEKIRDDRETAIAFEHAAQVLARHIERYEQLVEWLRVAQVRMHLAVAIRPDMQEIVAEAKADTERGTH